MPPAVSPPSFHLQLLASIARPAPRSSTTQCSRILRQYRPRAISVTLNPSSRRHASSDSQYREKSHTLPASDVNNNITQEEVSEYDKAIARNKDQQMSAPWHRQGSDKPPASRLRSAGAMTKGKLLTTPTRLFKLILPLTTKDFNDDRKDVEPLALLVHPQQPLSYLERLIQSEIPKINIDGKEKISSINFLAQDSSHLDHKLGDADRDKRKAQDLDNVDSQEGDNTHLRERSPAADQELRGGPGEGGVESYSGQGHESGNDNQGLEFVRWSKSTEIGDFMRDAARGREFAVQIEAAPYDIYVGVPSFGDRTYYLRLRLRKKARQIADMADIKHECDRLAQRSAQRVAYAGFGAMLTWAGVVTYCTFQTDLGWDFMEPVTYLVGMLGLLGGYGWFLFNRREASYASAMNLTVSRRQSQLYNLKGFDLQKYHELIEEGNALRREIRLIASEYDVDWDERQDAQDEKVIQALKRQRHRKKKGEVQDGDDKDDDDDDK